MSKANKGEWSEFYVFLKILSERKLFAADNNLEVIPGKYFVFHRIIREENDGERKIYDFNGPDNQIQILDEKEEIIMMVNDSSLPQKTKKIFEAIKNAGKGTFIIPEARELMDQLLCEKVKASGTRKEDIIGIIDDRISPTPIELGFSIKSMLGGASTLLNAGDTTNFIFKVTGFKGDKNVVNIIDGKSKIRDRIKKIREMGGELIFVKPKNSVFAGNLRKIDTVFAKIIANMLLDFYSGNASFITALTILLSRNSTLEEYGFSAMDFEYKIKNFLDSIALGMVPSKEWDGNILALGGYIVVKENGDVVCYHLYNRDEFRTYLFENTKFETASSTRHGFGSLYEEGGELFFNLNLQIRF
ncbi:MAG: HpaII family restriction endonuclease [Candidatus Gracilibacteria bacterium]|nr:HpaII family restriction endonuclease [Candidatus Gracilibacteria bacterium]